MTTGNFRRSSLVVLAAALIWFSLLGHRDLVDPDEGRYALIPHEMIASGDWVTPRLNGYKYFEKPPLQYWLTATSFLILGENNGAARLPVTVLGFLGALWVLLVGSRLFGPDAGLYAFLLTLSGFLYVALGHVLSLDMALSVFLTFGVGALLIAQSRREEPATVRNWMLLGWMALGLAVMSKGLVGLVLPGGTVLFYTIWQRDWALWRHLHIDKGLLVLLAVTVPWFVVVSLRNPEFPEFFFIHEHLARYTSNVHRRGEPWWYFLPWLVIGAVPWVAHLLRGLFSAPVRWRWGNGGFHPERFLWIYAVFILSFFSAGQSKLPTYILPMFPALALLAGRQMTQRPWVLPGSIFSLMLGTGLATAAIFAHLFESRSVPAAYLADLQPWLTGAGVALIAGGASAIWWRKSTRRALVLLSLTILLAFQLLGWGAQALSPSRSGRALAEAVRPHVDAGAEIFSVGSYVHSVSFYLGRPQTIVAYFGEMELGIRLEPERWIPDWLGFRRRWEEAERGVAVFEARRFPDYQRTGLRMQVIYEDPRKVAVVKP